MNINGLMCLLIHAFDSMSHHYLLLAYFVPRDYRGSTRHGSGDSSTSYESAPDGMLTSSFSSIRDLTHDAATR